MKTYFTRLFDYDQYANHIITDTILSANNTEKPVKLMGHLLAAQQVWFSRCAGGPPPALALWPDVTAGELGKIIDDNHFAWTAYLDTLTPDNFDRVIRYKTFQGTDFENKLVDILAHVINHGTHHRAQAGQELKFAGLEKLEMTDYILYLRGL